MTQENQTNPPESTTYEYGAMSSKFSLSAKNKLTAYAAMVFHYKESCGLVVIYSPQESEADAWTSITGQVTDRLDEVFGGVDSFDKYVGEHLEEIKECMRTIKRIV